MTDLSPITALGATAARSVHFGAYSLTENPGLTLASLALRPGTAEPAPFGMTLPGPAGLTCGHGVSAFWTGPGQWMICADDRAEQDFAATVKHQAPQGSVTEQTDAWVAFDISTTIGTVNPLLEKLANIDLSNHGPGSAIRTGMEHLGVFVIRRSDDKVRILGMRSAAGSLWHALETATRRAAAGTPA